MTILAMRRDTVFPAGAVSMVTNDTLAQVQAAAYLTLQKPAIRNVNNGDFVFDQTDIVRVSASDGKGFFNLNSTFTSLLPITL